MARRGYDGVTAAQRSADRRARLLQATLELVGDRGYRALTVAALRRSTGLNDRYFYEHFRTCDDIFDALIDELGALSASVEDADADTDAEHALFGEPGMPPPKDGWQRSRVLALFAQEPGAQEAVQLLQAQDFFDGCKVLGIAPVPDQDWVRLTQSQFTPVEITPEFWIVPTWHELPPQAVRSIRLDPGLAFGTGTHPTTRMCLRWIARQPGPFGRVLDYGCGSGILAIGAAKFGATDIDAVDIDEAAVETSARRHATANNPDIVLYLRLQPGESGRQLGHPVLGALLVEPVGAQRLRQQFEDR